MKQNTPSASTDGAAHQWTSTKRIWKNLLVLAVVFLVNFTAFRALQNLQSTLNSEAGLGVVSFSCVYASMVLSCLYAPFFIHKVGSCKWTVVTCLLGHALYTSSNFYPSWYTLVPSSVLLGASSGPLWTAQSTYLANSAQEYANILQHGTEGAMAKFNGVFYFLFDLSGISGNLISSLVLSTGRQDIGKGEFCGARDCGIRPENNWTTHYYLTNSTNMSYNSTGFQLDGKQQVIVYTLFGIYLSCNIFAILIACLFLDKDAQRKPTRLASEPMQMSQHLIRTLKVFKDFRFVLLTPLIFMFGMSYATVAGDYSKSYVSCVLGVQAVGYVLLCYRVTSSVFSLLSGHVNRYVGTRSLLIAAAVAMVALLGYMLWWQPVESAVASIYLVAGGWGATLAVWQTQLDALIGVLFLNNKEAAFAGMKMTHALGSAMTFAYSSAVCTGVKLFILLAVLAAGLVGYGVLEWKTRKEARNNSHINSLEELGDQNRNSQTLLDVDVLVERETSL
ncbi:protein unc-93 homolog A-like [Branchiostoma floridae]|uniref:Protein unc-93 homolog A n=1 Tax=Branchiostoma floridae TaxID=7739 RepID=A0A9J7MWS9_BRAFL|nr:protein unc-93 homolog A-like [Branchiostoma floridae]